MEFIDDMAQSQSYDDRVMEEIEIEVVESETQGYDQNGEFIEIPANQLGLVEMGDSPSTLREKLRAMTKKRKAVNRAAFLASSDEEEETPLVSPRERKMLTRNEAKACLSNDIGFEQDLQKMARQYAGKKQTMFLPSPQAKVENSTSQTSTRTSSPKSLMDCLPAKKAKQLLNQPEPEKLVPVHDQNVVTRGSFLLPSNSGRPKENIAYEFGSQQYRAVLGHNTIFKVKNIPLILKIQL